MTAGVQWDSLVSVVREFVETIGAISLCWAFLWTVFRSFTRERIYKILRSDFGARSGFVLGVVSDAKHRETFAKFVLDAVSHDNNKHRLKAIVSELYEEEREENRRTRHAVDELGRLTQDAVQRSVALEEMAEKLSDSTNASATANSVLAESMKNFASSLDHMRREMTSLSGKVDRTQEIILQSKFSRRQGDHDL
jgi:hypothetical protein